MDALLQFYLAAGQAILAHAAELPAEAQALAYALAVLWPLLAALCLLWAALGWCSLSATRRLHRRVQARTRALLRELD